jgi:hypothetical protein
MNEAWEKMSEYDQRPFRKLVQFIADYQTDAAALHGKPAEVHFIASRHAVENDERKLTLWFFFSKYQYVFAQSGSDWGEHHHWLGSAKFANGRLETVTMEHDYDTLTESGTDDYDEAAGAARARDAAIAKLAKA